MAGNGRFGSNSASPDSSFAGNHGQKGGYSGLSLDRCESFREFSDGRVLNSSKVASRGSCVNAGDVSNLSQCLVLEPFAVGDQRCPNPTDLKKALGIPIACSSEENTFSSHLRNSPPVSIEDLKRFRATVADTRIKASGRAKKMDEQLHRLNKYFEARSTKKQQRNDQLPSDRGGGAIMKMGNQINRSILDLGEHKSEDRPKNGTLNKRVRSSMAETWAEGRNSGLMNQPRMMPKDRDTNSADSDVGMDIKRRLPAGGESWDKRMKRKRSGGAGGPRNFDGEGEAKRTMHHKLSSESSLQSTDSQTFRLSNQEENDVDRLSPAISKGKVSRAPRSSSNMPMSVASNVPRPSGTLENWEMPQNMPKSASVNGTNNRKRAIPPSPSSSPITQWGGQRPQKNTRTRRANLHSPVSNHDEIQTPTEGFSPSKFSARLQSSGANNSFLSKGFTSGLQNTKGSPKITLLPSRLSDCEESGPGENRLQGKKFGCSGLEEKTVNATQPVGSSLMLMKKSKLLVKEETADGLRRQGRSERDSVSRASISPAREKSDNAAVTKPISVSHGSDKSGSRLGRPMKKLSERKGYTRLGHSSGGSLVFNGELDDDREELFAAANLAYNHCVIAAKGKLWETAESLFASVGSEKKSYLLQQLKITEALQQSLSQTLAYCNNIKADYMREEISLSDTLSEERSRSTQSKSEFKDMSSPVESVDQGKRSSSSGGVGSRRKFEHTTSLYQRVLSALITVDDIAECDQIGWDGCLLPDGASLDSPDDACLLVSDDVKNVDRMEFECESGFGLQTTSNGSVNGSLSDHANNTLGRLSAFQDSPCNGGTPVRENGCLNSEVQISVVLSSSDSDGAQSHGSSSVECPYEQLPIEEKLMSELNSIGLYPETVPDLHDKEDEVINEDIIQLKSGLHQQVGKKKAYLGKIYEALQGGKDVEGQEMEQVAMDKLVEMAHKRLLSTRGNLASKYGIPKVSRQVALGYARRTVARCRKFENSGVSCFDEPGLHDIIFAPPPRFDEAETWPGDGLGAILNSSTDDDKRNALEMSSRQSDQSFAKNGPILNRGKKKEVLLDDVGGAFNKTADSPLGGVKWKRSERDNNRHGSTKNGNAKAGRSSLLNSRVERKPKTKPKQKTTQLSNPGNGVNLKFSPGDISVQLFNIARSKRSEVGSSHNNLPLDSSMDVKRPVDLSNPSLNDIESIEELDGTGGIGADQDLNSWFSEVDGLQDHDPTEGLSIPMDDISDLFF